MKALILMAGSHRVKGVDEPATLLSWHGKTVLETLSEKVKSVVDSKDVIGILRDSDAKHYHMDNVFKLAFEGANIFLVHGETMGAACSAMLAIDYLENDTELLILGGDELVDVDFKDVISFFRENKADAGVVTFESIHPSFSFSQINENNIVEFVSEKKPISKNALVSFWYFKSSDDFIVCSKSMIRKNAVVNDIFFISPIMNEMILKDKHIYAFRINQTDYFPLKNEMQVRNYLDKK